MSTQTLQLLSQSHWLADGSQTVWNFSFTGGYINSTHVRAYKKSPAGVRTELTINYATDFIGPFQLLITPAVESGYTLVIYRDTSNGGLPLVDFSDGANVNEKNLDVVAKQAVFVSAETEDFLGVTTEADLVALGVAAAAAAGAAAASAANADMSADIAAGDRAFAEAASNSAGVYATNASNSAANASAAALTQVNLLKADLASSAVGKGSKLIAFIQRMTGAIARWIEDKFAEYVSPMDFGAAGTGAVDDSAAIRAAFTASRKVHFGDKTYRIDTKIDTIQSGTDFDLGSCTINGNVGNTNPIFEFAGAKERLKIRSSGAVVTGTFKSFLRAAGTVANPAAINQYARFISIEDLTVASTTAELFLDLFSVNTVNIRGCSTSTISGVDETGKCVDVVVHGNTLFPSTSNPNTFGWRRVSSVAGFFHEGLHMTDNTIGPFAKCLNIVDNFGFTWTGGYLDSPSGFTMDFAGPGISGKNDTIEIGNTTSSGKIRFAPTSSVNYAASLTNVGFINASGTNLQFANNASGISATNLRFGSSTAGVAIETIDNNANITIDGITADSTFVGGVQIKGLNGGNVVVENLNYGGSGDALYIERPILAKNIPISTANVWALKNKLSTANVAGGGAIAVGATITTLAVTFAKGEHGTITLRLPFSSATAATQNMQVSLPSGMQAPGGTGYGTVNCYLGATSGPGSFQIPYYCTASGSGNITVINQAGSGSLVIDNQAFIAKITDW